MKQVMMFQAIDGAIFTEAEQCKRHEKMIEDHDKINSFLVSPDNPYVKSAHKTVAENVLIAFMAWLRDDVPVLKEEMEDDEVEEHEGNL